ncbi:MAG: hypothetical protein ACOX51_07450 [Myxococcota bacterium]|nr:hypothetical protein [Myxococcota bacterium]HHW96010.1 hypothetical protein [Oligoflexales bacterium]
MQGVDRIRATNAKNLISSLQNQRIQNSPVTSPLLYLLDPVSVNPKTQNHRHNREPAVDEPLERGFCPSAALPSPI